MLSGWRALSRSSAALSASAPGLLAFPLFFFASFAFPFLLSDIGKHLLLSLVFFALLFVLNAFDFILFCGLALRVEAVRLVVVPVLLLLALLSGLRKVRGLALGRRQQTS